MLNTLASVGFEGVLIDKTGYAAPSQGPGPEVREVTGTNPLVSGDGRYEFFSLRGYKPRHREFTLEGSGLLAAAARVKKGCFLDAVNHHPPASQTIVVPRANLVDFMGWAADLDSLTVPGRAVIRLTGPNGTFYATADRFDRSDVAATYKSDRLRPSGFILTAGTTAVPAGSYAVAVIQGAAGSPEACDLGVILRLE
jgi:hypothetical protein